MALSLTVNGTTYTFPVTGDENWGSEVTNWANAVTSGMLQKAGGTFTLTAEADFGASYGLKSLYYKSRATNPASAGQIRLGNTDNVSWRNAANNADINLTVNASDKLTYNSIELSDISSAQTLTNKTMSGASNTFSNIGYSSLSLSGAIVNADINASAAIAYSKLNLSNSIVNADVSNSAAIAYSKLNLTGSLVDADVNASAAIAYSKLALTGSIVNADINNSAAIAYSKLSLGSSIVNSDISNSAAIAYSKLNLGSSIVNADINASAAISYSKLNLTGAVTSADLAGSIALSKLAATTASRALASDGSGVITPSTTTATELGYVSGVTSAIQTQLNAKISNTLTTTTGDMIYASSANTPARLPIGASNQVLKVSGGIPTWAAAPTGGVNYAASNPDAEGNVTTGWATFADAASTTPTDGTGGSPNCTWTVTSSSPLRGTYSFLFTKNSGASRQGEGASFDFTIDAADKGKVIPVSFEYAIASGTFADDDMTVWIYDVTNATMIQPAPYKLKNHSLAAERFSCEFQSSSSSTSYRLIFYVPVTTNSANTVKFDNFNIGPQAKLYGSPVTDWVSYTPTTTWVSNTTATGYWRRVGDSAEFDIRISLTGAPTSAELNVDLPSGMTIDTTKLLSDGGNSTNLGMLSIEDSGTGAYTGRIRYLDSNTVSFVVDSVGGTYGAYAPVSATVPMTFANNDYVTATFKVPILGWSSSVVMSSDADTRVVAAIMNLTSTQSSINTNSSSVKLNLNQAAVDTHGAVNTGTYRWTCPVAGYYRVSARATLQGTNVIANADAYLTIYRNGSERARGISSFGPASTGRELGITSLLYLSVGDYLELYFYGAGNNSASTLSVYGDTGGANYTSMHIEKVSGPAQIAASETVACRATKATGNQSSTGNFQDVASWTLVADTHGALNVTTGIFTAPVSGLYQVTGAISFAANGSGQRACRVAYNGSTAIYEAVSFANASYVSSCPFATTVRCLAGDTIKIQGYQDSGGNLNYTTSAAYNNLNIVRVGNY